MRTIGNPRRTMLRQRGSSFAGGADDGALAPRLADGRSDLRSRWRSDCAATRSRRCSAELPDCDDRARSWRRTLNRSYKLQEVGSRGDDQPGTRIKPAAALPRMDPEPPRRCGFLQLGCCPRALRGGRRQGSVVRAHVAAERRRGADRRRAARDRAVRGHFLAHFDSILERAPDPPSARGRQSRLKARGDITEPGSPSPTSSAISSSTNPENAHLVGADARAEVLFRPPRARSRIHVSSDPSPPTST